MRVLAICVPSPGHLNPLLPLLGAFAAQGDEVVVASGAEVADAVGRAGLRLHPAGAGFPEWFTALRARTRGTPGEGLPPERIAHYFTPRLFAEIAAADMLDGALEAAREVGPDVVVFESEAYAGPLVAARSGAPALHLQVGFLPLAEVAELVADALSPLWSNAGQRIDRQRAVYGDLLLQTAPHSLDPARAPTSATALRPTPVPATPPAPDDPPLVHVTFGTALHHDLDALRSVLDALADEPVRVLATIGSDEDPDWVGAVPANAAVERFVPHSHLLPRCSAVVHHGGAGTMYAVLAHGLPQVVVPTGADQFDNAARIRAAGLGATLDSHKLTPEAVRAAVRAVLHDDAMRACVRRVAAEIRSMPAAEVVARELRSRFARD